MSCFGSPTAHVVSENDVRRELVAERDPLLREGRRERDVVRLLEISPQIGLDVDDHGLRALHPREQQPHVVPVRSHRRCVAQVGEIGVGLVSPARLRLQQHVVRQDGDLSVPPRVGDVHRRERPVRVPRRPALPRVHAAGEILVAKAERGCLAQRGGVAGRVTEPELQRLRPAGGQRWERSGTGARARGAHADESEDRGDCRKTEHERPSHRTRV